MYNFWEFLNFLNFLKSDTKIAFSRRAEPFRDPVDARRASPDDSDHPRVRANTEPDCLKIKGRVNSRQIGKAYLVERSKN